MLELCARPLSSEASENSDDAGDEQPLATEQVGGAAAQQQEAAEHERVGVDDPLQVGVGEVAARFWIDGSATFTTVASSTTMNCARQTMTSTSQRLVSVFGMAFSRKRIGRSGSSVTQVERPVRLCADDHLTSAAG